MEERKYLDLNGLRIFKEKLDKVITDNEKVVAASLNEMRAAIDDIDGKKASIGTVNSLGAKDAELEGRIESLEGNAPYTKTEIDTKLDAKVNNSQLSGYLTTAAASGTYLSMTDAGNIYAKKADIPSLSDIEGRLTTLENKDNIAMKVVPVLPLVADADEKTLYLVTSSDGEAGNLYDEYIIANGAWEKVGSASIDLDGYVKAEVQGTNLIFS